MEQVEIIVQDGNRYVYTISYIKVENSLGIEKATLKKYTLYRMPDAVTIIGNIFKTKEGSWYDIPGESAISPQISTMIKMAIDECEQAND